MSVELYDPVANPYAPGAGTPPPALVGRDPLIEAADVALRRLMASRSAQHQLLTGLRGTGKTVLLNTLGSIAERHQFRVVRQEAMAEGEDTVVSLLRQARRILADLETSSATARALRSIEAVALTISGTGLRMERGAESPDREALSDVIVDVATATAERGVGLMVALDEAQLLAAADLRRVLMGVHRCSQDGLPLWCVLAGLPNLVERAAKAVTYAERMFHVERLDPLSPDQVAQAIRQPAEELGVSWADASVHAVVDRSDGYPFFVQMWGYHTWNVAADEPISLEDVHRAVIPTELDLDSSFFAARIARIPPSEIAYVAALASLGSGSHRSREVASAMGATSSQVSSFRDRLIREGVIFAPGFGRVEFAIPHFDEYVRRTLQ